jgi:hypothetical protein
MKFFCDRVKVCMRRIERVRSKDGGGDGRRDGDRKERKKRSGGGAVFIAGWPGTIKCR